jgi:GH25 family lysozyme M1 (1,4-beta-N-acetylmuramidase)
MIMATSFRVRLLLCAWIASGCGAQAPEPTTSFEQAICNGDVTLEGIDVSDWQGTNNWSSIRASGRMFAFAKATEGSSIINWTFAGNWPAMKTAGLVRGAYHFFKGGVDGVAQANYFLAVVNANGGLQAGDLPLAVDIERQSNPVTSSLTGNNANDISRLSDMLQTLESRTGRKPIIYTNWDTWNTLGNPQQFQAYPAWIASWGGSCAFVPNGLPNVKIWQYTVGSGVPGVGSASVDLDKLNGSYDDLLAFAGGSGGRTTCDNGVPIGGTACNPSDPGAEFVCVDPNQPSAGQWRRSPCATGQSCSGTHCQGGPPPCGSGLYCSLSPIPGASACTSGSQIPYCCPYGQKIVNGACVSPPPQCGYGLYCSGGPIPGASLCTSNGQNIYCCAYGHTIVNGACN